MSEFDPEDEHLETWGGSEAGEAEPHHHQFGYQAQSTPREGDNEAIYDSYTGSEQLGDRFARLGERSESRGVPRWVSPCIRSQPSLKLNSQPIRLSICPVMTFSFFCGKWETDLYPQNQCRCFVSDRSSSTSCFRQAPVESTVQIYYHNTHSHFS